MNTVNKYQHSLRNLKKELEILQDEYEGIIIKELEKVFIGKLVYVKNSGGCSGVVDSLYLHRNESIMLRIKLDAGGTFSLYADEVEIAI